MITDVKTAYNLQAVFAVLQTFFHQSIGLIQNKLHVQLNTVYYSKSWILIFPFFYEIQNI